MKSFAHARVHSSIVGSMALVALAVASIARADCPPTNTCYGNNALLNTTGSQNTGFGDSALLSNTTGNANTAIGYSALNFNTTGLYNTASGQLALYSNATGNDNTASGMQALYSNTTGSDNTAHGFQALFSNTTGTSNTASGINALYLNSTGKSNDASGYWALANNSTGSYNTASGAGALQSSSTGTRNVALGFQAGFALTTGSNNIMIGAQTKGKAADDGVIRIGRSDMQKKSFMAGVRGIQTDSSDAVEVFIDKNGQFGTIQSSARYKEDVQPLGDRSERLYALRPVSFKYKAADEDGSQPTQFGLIAEEVAGAFPELVVPGEDGKPETVKYHVLATLLLNELKKHHQVSQDQAAELTDLKLQVAAMAKVIERIDHAQSAAPQPR